MNKYLTTRRTGEFFRSVAQLTEHHDGSKGSTIQFVPEVVAHKFAYSHITGQEAEMGQKTGLAYQLQGTNSSTENPFSKEDTPPYRHNQIVAIYSNTLVNGGFQISHHIMLPMAFIGLMSLLIFLDQNVLSAHNQKFPQSDCYNIVQKPKVFF